jgi:pyridoxamine 5'-phosphate oxidase
VTLAHDRALPDADPFERFAAWFAEAERAEPELPEAMTVASVDAQGRPSARMLLLKGVDPAGFVFYTNFDSRKSRELKANPRAELCFHWKSLRRQVRIEGAVAPVADREADAYFASRPYGSQIGAWASLQSETLPDRATLERRVAEFEARYPEGKVPRPPNWSGFRLVPERIEFWRDMPFRLHERLLYTRAGDRWTTEWLYP